MRQKIINTGFGIMVVDGGNVFVGEYSFFDGDTTMTITGGSVIRRWGTTKGLGELAEGGPTDKTILDPLNRTVRPFLGRVLFILDATAGDWS